MECSLDTKYQTGQPVGQKPVGHKDALLLLQHPPVYTLGQGADTRFLRFVHQTCDYEVYRVERGGEVTYHCPGQLVGYPILDLKRHRTDLHWYLRQLEEVIIQTLAVYGLVGDRIAGMTGVWLEGCKVAAIGIKVSRWITMHGFALNVCPDLAGFDQIVPCGLEGKRVGSLAQFLPEISLEDVRSTIVIQFEQIFGMKLILKPLPGSMAAFAISPEALKSSAPGSKPMC
ncbi:MAG: lipoyl(octanoyl) transferase LipB [Phormidesmis sp. RL_2_1]|nr:lipoyl(octanoyl) transferase LipB [Phormidesmis sp. RL_2_1]